MSVAVSPSFRRQLNALLKVRRTIDRTHRQQAPKAWLWKQLLLWGLAIVFVGMAFIGGWAIAIDDRVDQARAGVLFLFAPTTAAGYLLVAQMRDSSGGGHPIGELRRYLPLSRRRSALLRLVEDTLQPGSVFVFAYGWATWIGVALSGQSWLNGWGWLTVSLVAAFSILVRHAFSGLQAWGLEAATGTMAAFARVGITVGIITLPFWANAFASAVSLDDLDLFSLPLLREANSWHGPVLSAGVVFATAVLALWIRTWRPIRPRLPRAWNGLRFPPSPTFSFRDGRPELVMTRMMVVQALRQPTYRYSAIMLALFGGLSTVLPSGTGVMLILLTGFMQPVTNYFNLYGADSRAYQLWLGSGRTLREWTVARQIFTTLYMAIFVYVGGLMLLLSGSIDPSHAPGLSALPVLAASLGLLAGPPVSRLVCSPQSAEIGFRTRPRNSARAFGATAGATLTGLLVLAPGIPLARTEFWWTSWLAAAFVVAVLIAVRPARVTWSPELRTRMASAFRS